ncbi:MAG: hypothetical protein CMM61_07490, partial [Rhodospirillaceae bacterium]|nr:hypothetical protein [Rhodospirillaceae bacterium]
FAHGAPAGAIVTTGPGFFNLITGIAACYYDNVPSVFLCGQVNRGLNKAAEFQTKMYGFQEAPHAEIAEFIADTTIKVGTDSELSDALAAIARISTREANGPLVLEIQDDFQRQPFAANADAGKVKAVDAGAVPGAAIDVDGIAQALASSERPVFAVGGGVWRTDDNARALIDRLARDFSVPTVFSWGGQRLQNYENPFHVGLFGGHSPGAGNSLVQQSDLMIAVGLNLLQHQAGKAHDIFAPNARIIAINRDTRELARLHTDFGDRLAHCVGDSVETLEGLETKLRSEKSNTIYWPEYGSTESAPDWRKQTNPTVSGDIANHQGVASIAAFLDACPKSYWAFSDAGATLSWTYQAADQCMSPPISTSFNLHTMGYSLPAAVGAAVSNGCDGVLSISGDGAFMMNIQELAVANNLDTPIKILIIDNEGYGIIRQTQDAFLGGRHFATDIGKSPNLPPYDLAKLISAFGIETKKGNRAEVGTLAEWLFEPGSGHRAVVVSVDKAAIVEHTTPNNQPLVF